MEFELSGLRFDSGFFIVLNLYLINRCVYVKFFDCVGIEFMFGLDFVFDVGMM